jgi:hypothetical protein
MAIDIVIQGDYRDRDIKRAQRDLDLLGKQSGATGAAFAKMSGLAAGMGAAIGTAAIQAVSAGAQMAFEFGVNGVKAFIADDAAAKRLAQTLSNLGLEGATAAVEANVDSLQRAAGVADDVLRPALGRLLTSTGNVAEANKLLALAVDVSAGTGRDLNQVVQALARASDGSTAGLSRLGAGLDKATLATGDMDLITKQLAATFGGQASVKAASFQGQIDRVGIAFGELQESFGRGFMAGVVSGFNDGRNAGDQLADTLQALEPTFYDLGQTIGGVVQYVPQLMAGFKLMINGATLTRETYLSLVKALYAASQAVRGDFEGAAATARDALDRVTTSGDSVIAAFNELTSGAIPAARGALSGTVASAVAAGNALGGTGGGGGGGGGTSLAGGASSAAEKTVILTDKQKNLALTMAGTQVAVKQVTDEIAALTKTSDDYAASTTAAIQGTVSLSTAFSDALKASEAGTLAAGQTVAGATIANLTAQIEATKAFEASLKAIYAAGGSLALIEQLRKTALEQGMPAGTLLATEVLTGGFVPALTAQLKDFDVFAGDAGQRMADNFFKQGITDANALLNGLSTEVAAQQKMLDRLGKNIGLPVAAAISEEIAQAIRDGVADGRAVAARRRAEAFAAASFVPITVAPGAPGAAAFTGGGMVNIPGRAAGGPVSGGRPYMVGERGPELFVPGSNGNVVPNNAMGGNSYTINVNAGVGDPRAIGQQIVEYVKKFEQANGPVFRAA